MSLLIIILWPILSALFIHSFSGIRKNISNPHTVRKNMSLICGFGELLLCAFSIGEDSAFASSVMGYFGMSFGGGVYSVYLAIIAVIAFIITIFATDNIIKDNPHGANFYFFLTLSLGFTVGIALSEDFYSTFAFFAMLQIAFLPLMFFMAGGGDANFNTDERTGYPLVSVIVPILSDVLFAFGMAIITRDCKSHYYSALSAVSQDTYLPTAGAILIFLAVVVFIVFILLLPSHLNYDRKTSVVLIFAIGIIPSVLKILPYLTINSFYDDELWLSITISVGLMAMTCGCILTALSKRLNQTTGYLELFCVGFFINGCGIYSMTGSGNALYGSIIFIGSVSVSLLIIASITITINHQAKNDFSPCLNGIAYKEPILLLGIIIASCNILGIPMLDGFYGKSFIIDTFLDDYMFAIIAMFNTASVIVGTFIIRIFFGAIKKEKTKGCHAISLDLPMKIIIIMLSAFPVLLGIYYIFFESALLTGIEKQLSIELDRYSMFENPFIFLIPVIDIILSFVLYFIQSKLNIFGNSALSLPKYATVIVGNDRRENLFFRLPAFMLAVIALAFSILTIIKSIIVLV